MEINIEDSFELLSRDEWGYYLGSNIFKDMYIDASRLGVSRNTLQNFEAPRLGGMIFQHNNKVGALKCTYALCRHYYDMGIPDDPWYMSPGKNGESIQYMPNFSEEHWGRQFWYNYFANTFYLRISALWDSIIEILNHYYGYNFSPDGRLRDKVFKSLENDKPELHNLFIAIKKDKRYKDAQEYRTMAAHGTFDGDIHDMIKVEYDKRTDNSERDENGNLILKDDKNKLEKSKSITAVSYGVGDYINAETIMMNIEEYSKFMGIKIQEIVECMIGI